MMNARLEDQMVLSTVSVDAAAKYVRLTDSCGGTRILPLLRMVDVGARAVRLHGTRGPWCNFSCLVAMVPPGWVQLRVAPVRIVTDLERHRDPPVAPNSVLRLALKRSRDPERAERISRN